MSSASVPVVRIGSPADLVRAVPFLVGHVPHESLVVVGTRPPAGRIVLTARHDLPPAGEERGLADVFAAAFARSAVREAYAVIFTGQPVQPGRSVRPLLPQRPLAAALRAGLERRRIRLRDLLLVGPDRWWSYRCRVTGCCPPEGTPLAPAQPDELALATVLSGRAVLPDRAAMVASVAPLTGPAAQAALAAQRQARRQWRASLAGGDPAALRADALVRIRTAVRGQAEGRRLGEAEAAHLIVALDDPWVRDAVVAGADPADGVALVGLLVDLTRRARPPHAGNVAATLAWAAYTVGDGALANVALDRAFERPPPPRMAVLLAHALAYGLPAEQIRKANRQTRVQLGLA